MAKWWHIGEFLKKMPFMRNWGGLRVGRFVVVVGFVGWWLAVGGETGHPVGHFVVYPFDVFDGESELLEVETPTDDDGGLGKLNPLKILMVGLDEEFLALEIPLESFYACVDAEGFAFVDVPVACLRCEALAGEHDDGLVCSHWVD